QRLVRTLEMIGDVGGSVAVTIVRDGVIPVIAPTVDAPLVALGRSRAEHLHRRAVADEGVVREADALRERLERNADVSAGDQVAPDVDPAAARLRGAVEEEAGRVVNEAVASDEDVVRVLEQETVRRGAVRERERVLGELDAAAVHDRRAHLVVLEAVAPEDVVVRVHVVKPVAAGADDVVLHDGPRRVPDDDVAAALDVVARETAAGGVPESDAVPAADVGQVLADDRRAVDEAAIALGDEDAEEAVLD